MPDNKLTKNRLWMIALIVIISTISAVLLTTIYIYTSPRIALNAEIKLKKGVLSVFNIPFEKKEIIEIFDKNIRIKSKDLFIYYEYYKRNRLNGIAFEIKGPGFWGPITALVALEPDMRKLKGVEILHQEETPGLGGRIAEDEFKDQFKGKPVVPEIAIDAITGATMTSKAFKKIINENVKSFRKEYKGG